MASKRQYPLVTSPKHLIFNAPYNRIQGHELTLINSTQMILLFKVKSNSAKHYSVRPNAGQVEPFSIYRVIITLSYFGFQPDVCYRHHFSVESIYRPVDGLRPGESPLWVFQRTPPSDICVVRVPVHLQAAPLSTSQKNVAHNLKHGDKQIGSVNEPEKEPQLKKEPALEKREHKQPEKKQPNLEIVNQKQDKTKPQLQQTDQKPSFWLIVIILACGFLVAGFFSDYIISQIWIVIKSIRHNVKFSYYHGKLSNYGNICVEKFWTYWKISIENLSEYENIWTLDLLNYLKYCSYEKGLNLVDSSDLLTPQNGSLLGSYESTLNSSFADQILGFLKR
ncbi:vesicle-associated membrane protein-associated protein B-like [Drosophila madeirensis]|uniref:Vesicle-associated membrane protein-associated protein B-like n=1 Tax=Drosophila madeirensis TaxID=30013 RepID=A0AAU9FJ47_DROMD